MANKVPNTLYATSVDLVMSYLSDDTWLYREAKASVIDEFGSEDRLYMNKDASDKIYFFCWAFLPKFADCFYHLARKLLGSGTIRKLMLTARWTKPFVHIKSCISR